MLCPKCGGSGFLHSVSAKIHTCWICFGGRTVSKRLAPEIPWGPEFITMHAFSPTSKSKDATEFRKELLGPLDKTFAHIVSNHLGWFKSVSEARKQGWGIPITNESHAVGKRQVCLV